MSEVPAELHYTESHEWVREEDDGLVTVGITDYAQTSLGDLVFVETPETGAQVEAGDACAVVESVKAASDVYAPLSGEIVEVNDELESAPERVNEDPYGDGWLFRIRPADVEERGRLLDAEAYQRVMAEAD
jgi:glycine cleavage system H protein